MFANCRILHHLDTQLPFESFSQRFLLTFICNFLGRLLIAKFNFIIFARCIKIPIFLSCLLYKSSVNRVLYFFGLNIHLICQDQATMRIQTTIGSYYNCISYAC